MDVKFWAIQNVSWNFYTQGSYFSCIRTLGRDSQAYKISRTLELFLHEKSINEKQGTNQNKGLVMKSQVTKISENIKSI